MVDEVGLIKIHNPQKLIRFLSDAMAAAAFLLSATGCQVAEDLEIGSVFFVVF